MNVLIGGFAIKKFKKGGKDGKKGKRNSRCKCKGIDKFA